MKVEEARIVFMGSPDFALPTLQTLAGHFNVVGVATQPDRPSGRGRKLSAPPVKELALQLDIDLIQPKSLKKAEAFEQLKSWAPDVIIVAAFGQILRKNVLALPPLGCVNVHASLLPRWRGAAPIHAALLAGDSESGITIMQMDAGLDTGPILRQAPIPIASDETAGSLSEKLAILGGDLLLDTLPDFLAGDITPTPQSDEISTYAPMLKREQGELDFNKSAIEIARKVRAFHPWPGTFFKMGATSFKVHKARVVAGQPATSGMLDVVEDYPAVTTRDGWVVLEQLQAPGKRTIDGKDFLRGSHHWRGSVSPKIYKDPD